MILTITSIIKESVMNTDIITNESFMSNAFAKGLPFDQYIASGTPEQQSRWTQVTEAIKVTADQTTLFSTFTREMKVLIISGLWCGDCVEQGPMAHILATLSDKIELRYIDRDTIPPLRDQVKVCGGTRVPVAIFMAEDYAHCSTFGDRTLTRYRALQENQLGTACSTGLFLPAEAELVDTIQDWANEFERIQIMLRLSTRLRTKHND